MRSLIARFYSGSPVTRIITVVTWLVILSTAATIYSFTNLSGQLRDLNSGNGQEITYRGFENLPELRGFKFIDEDLRAGFNSWKYLSDSAEKLLLEAKNKNPRRLSEKIEGLDAEIISHIQNLNKIDWKHLVLFASPQLDPLSNDMVESFRKIRKTASFLACFHQRFKEKQPEQDGAFVLEAIAKVARMNDFNSPFLIGKMITIAVDGIAVRSIALALKDEKSAPEEMEKYLQTLKLMQVLDKPFKTAMEDEFIFFRHAYGQVYSKAPLAMWVLELIHGSPFKEYEKLSRQMMENPAAKIELSFISHNPVLVIAFPNFRKANYQWLEKTALKSLLIATIEQKLGKSLSAVDPYDMQPVRSMQKDGQTLFYCIGPDKVDNQGTGDDVLLPADFEL